MIARVLFVVAAVAVAAVLLLGGGESYRVKVPLDNALGLKDGGAVRIGGENRGKLELSLAKDDKVIAALNLDQPVGRDAVVSVVSANFLGTKRIEIDPGDAEGSPAPDGFTLPAEGVAIPTDLDQVLGVFDADTRTRMRILLNEAGTAVMGRAVDIDTLFKEFPIGLQDAAPILGDISADNATMRALVERSDRFLATAVRERKELVRLIDTLGTTAATVNTRRTELRATLARAPRTLRTLRTFSQDLLDTTQQLGPAARQIAQAAPPLRATLAEVDSVRAAAEPALATAVDVAPDLSRLAGGATPVLRRAQPTIRSLAALGEAAPPVTEAVNNSFDNIVAILENWSRAIQFRDGLSHVFRGEASFSPDAFVGAVDRLSAGARSDRRQERRAKAPTRTAPAPATPDQQRDPVGDILQRLPKLPLVPDLVDRLPVKPTVQQLEQALDPSGRDQPVTGILDYLLSP